MDFHKYLRYCADTGHVYRTKYYRSINTEKPTGYVSKVDGYIRSGLFGKNYLNHRLAWYLTHGNWPIQIDHINGNRSDNRLVNLREVTSSGNRRNVRLLDNNQTGVTGVYYAADRDKYHVMICGKHIAHVEDFFEACCLRKSEEVKHNYHPNHGRII